MYNRDILVLYQQTTESVGNMWPQMKDIKQLPHFRNFVEISYILLSFVARYAPPPLQIGAKNDGVH
jgi:hypothetical protein